MNKLSQKNKKIYSNGGQDGIIEYIISNIDIENKFCVEFGYDSVSLTGGCGPNCGNLVKNQKWENLFLGDNYENKEINLYKHFLTTDNIVDIFKKYDVPINLGYLSIDVDSTDLWLTDKLLAIYKPSFFSVEFNPNIPLEYAITVPNDPKFRWGGDKIFGCSLKCLDIISKKYNYSLVYAGQYDRDGHHDAFFVRNDLIKPEEKKYIPKLHDFNNVIVGIHKRCTNDQYKICLDYESNLKVNNISKILFC